MPSAAISSNPSTYTNSRQPYILAPLPTASTTVASRLGVSKLAGLTADRRTASCGAKSGSGGVGQMEGPHRDDAPAKAVHGSAPGRCHRSRIQAYVVLPQETSMRK